MGTVTPIQKDESYLRDCYEEGLTHLDALSGVVDLLINAQQARLDQVKAASLATLLEILHEKLTADFENFNQTLGLYS